MDAIFLIAEQHGGVPDGQSLELCAAARIFDEYVVAFTWGEGSRQAGVALGSHGVSRVLDLGDLETGWRPQLAAAM